MNKHTAEGLKDILEIHTKWLNNDDGLRANLSCVDLRGFDLCEANLSGADLRGAILSRVDLRGAILSGADLRGADLHEANLNRANLMGAILIGVDLSGAGLCRADLRGADLSRTKLIGADLSGADLRGAILSGADLRGADLHEALLPGPKLMNSICPLHCPEEGSFIGWKKAFVVLPDESVIKRDVEVIIKLQIPGHAKRSSATSRKCRCDRAKVLDIQSLDGVSLPKGTIALSKYYPSFTYEVGQKLYVEDFDDDRWNECSTGIHFFITRQEAVDY